MKLQPSGSSGQHYDYANVQLHAYQTYWHFRSIAISFRIAYERGKNGLALVETMWPMQITIADCLAV